MMMMMMMMMIIVVVIVVIIFLIISILRRSTCHHHLLQKSNITASFKGEWLQKTGVEVAAHPAGIPDVFFHEEENKQSKRRLG